METVIPKNAVLLPPVCQDFGICEVLHEAQHGMAPGHRVKHGRRAAPIHVRVDVEIVSKLAWAFKPLQITPQICYGKQLRARLQRE